MAMGINNVNEQGSRGNGFQEQAGMLHDSKGYKAFFDGSCARNMELRRRTAPCSNDTYRRQHTTL